MLPEVLASRGAALRWEANEKVFGDLQRKLEGFPKSGSEVLEALSKGLRQRDPQRFEAAFGRLAEILGRRLALDKRRSLLKRLGAAAPAWATAIAHRNQPHAGSAIPGDAEAAWLWRQLNDTLDARAKASPEEIQQRIETLNESLRRTTVDLIDRLAWAAQARRTTLPQRQALMGWEQVIRRIGKGTGKRVVRLEAEARQLMEKCRSAVPVWIMPLTRVVDNFNPASTRFDVVIIDEASQCDVMALIALYMAKQVVVVGDHEQVSPDAVGQNVSQVQHLIDEHLTGIPNSNLYDGQLSIYDLARQSFGGLISLKEHFRCVSEIIQFSNHLSYNGTIRPLRDSASTNLRPFVLEHRVEGTSTEQKTNPVEAREIASLVAAAVEQSDCEGKSIGVISLLGEEQAWDIERLLRHHLSPADFEERRIVCGNAAHFQGDERDMMFLSVVDSPREGPLAMREQPLFKKRFNVAASRAKDQMWVVHSLRPEVDLKPGDLRRRIIEYSRDPNAIIRLLERHDQRAESEFERLVIRYLVSAGYKVTPQWKVGHYRIDLVVSGHDGTKLAIECDGDRYHPHEKLAEDMGRQAVLERLGWRFVRIRGSQFFRDQERAMRPVFERIKNVGIEPQGPDGSGPAPESAQSELRATIIRRAAELRKEWESNPEAESESPSRRKYGQRNRRSPERESAEEQLQLTPEQPDGDDDSAGDESGRNIDDVPQDEIREVFFRLLPATGKMPRESLIRAAVKPLGFKRLARKIRKRLNHAIAGLVRTGKLATDWESVWRTAK